MTTIKTAKSKPPAFAKARKLKSDDEPAGLDAFAASAPGADSAKRKGRIAYEISIGLSAEEQFALEKLALADRRSKRQVISLLLGPALLAAAKELEK